MSDDESVVKEANWSLLLRKFLPVAERGRQLVPEAAGQLDEIESYLRERLKEAEVRQ